MQIRFSQLCAWRYHVWLRSESGSVLALPYEIKASLEFGSELVHMKLEGWSRYWLQGNLYDKKNPNGLGRFPCGYADDWIRKCKSLLVLIKGDYCPIVGRVPMDQVTVRLPEELPHRVKRLP